MSLEQKAKTFYELGKEWMKTKVDDSINNEKWIRLEDAQQEIDQKNHAIAEMRDYLKAAVEGAMKLNDLQLKLDEWERERGLLKQKLREFWKWLEQKAWRGVSSEVIDEFGERFEELLK